MAQKVDGLGRVEPKREGEPIDPVAYRQRVQWWLARYAPRYVRDYFNYLLEKVNGTPT